MLDSLICWLPPLSLSTKNRHYRDIGNLLGTTYTEIKELTQHVARIIYHPTRTHRRNRRLHIYLSKSSGQ